MSMKLTPAASTFTRASPGLGWGVSTSSSVRTSGPPGVWTRMAFMRRFEAMRGPRRQARPARQRQPLVPVEAVLHPAAAGLIALALQPDALPPPDLAGPRAVEAAGGIAGPVVPVIAARLHGRRGSAGLGGVRRLAAEGEGREGKTEGRDAD